MADHPAALHDQAEPGWLSTAISTGWQPPLELDATRPQTARVYDYFLGGKDNYEADRETAKKVLEVWPTARKAAQGNRNFLNTAVQYVSASCGISQFLDIGTGIPTEPNVHQVAQYQCPEARVVYVDHDPIVMTHARALMGSTGTVSGRIDYVQGDVRDPQALLVHPCLAGPEPALDFTQPVAINLVAVLHFLPDEDEPKEVVRTLMDRAPVGSYLIASHATLDFNPAEVGPVIKLYRDKGMPLQLRSKDEFLGLLPEYMEPVPPGVQPVNRWHPGSGDAPQAQPLFSDAEVSCYGLVARKG